MTENKIMLSEYIKDAKSEFDRVEKNLLKIEKDINNKMNGKTIAGTIGSIIFSIAWIGAFIVLFYYSQGKISSVILWITVIFSGLLFLSMLIDYLVNISYYSKINKFSVKISRLISQVKLGNNSMTSKNEVYRNSKENGWDCMLKPESSIFEKSKAIATSLNSIESIKNGFIVKIKNFFFFSSNILITILGCLLLFEPAEEIVNNLWGDISDELITVLFYIGTGIVVIGSTILAKLIWSKTDCNVTNITLFSFIIGPVAFFALVLLVCLLVGLVIMIAGVLLVILGVGFVIALLIAFLSGG